MSNPLLQPTPASRKPAGTPPRARASRALRLGSNPTERSCRQTRVIPAALWELTVVWLGALLLTRAPAEPTPIHKLHPPAATTRMQAAVAAQTVALEVLVAT